MGKKHRDKNKQALDEGGTPPASPPAPPPARPLPRWLAWMVSPWTVLLILAVGAVLRLWGITERHFVDPDTAGQFMGGDVYRMTWRWHHSGADKTISLPHYIEREMGINAPCWADNGKPLNLILRAFIIFLTGDYSIIAHSILDLLFALAAMGLMLRWCYKHLGARIAILTGCLWLVSGAQFQCTGRGYDYSAMLLFGTLAWLAFMKRGSGSLYRYTFLAGLSLGAGVTYHYSFVNYLPLLAIFILLFRNPAGIKGKVLEIAVFATGIVVLPLAIIGWYRWLALVTGATEWKWGIWSPLFEQGNTFGDMRVGMRFFANGWFLWQYLNGYLFMLFLFAGLVSIAVLHIRHYGWRWSICDDPLFILTGITAYGLLIWGIYSCIEARIQMPELAAWPVVAAMGVHYTTRFVSEKILRGRGINVIQTVLIAVIMVEQWQLTAPLVRMGEGFRKAMVVISGEGKTVMGEGDSYGVWPCGSRPMMPVRPSQSLVRWECLDDFLQTNGYDYFFVSYGRVLTDVVMYPRAGHPLMLDTYNRLIAKASPVWRFEFGAPINARLERMNMGWTRQTFSMEAWRKHNPQPTPYDVLVERESYFDVYRSSDVISAFHESRVNLLAQLMILQQMDPNQFQQIAPRFNGFIQYNATNPAVMTEAKQAAAKMAGSQR